MPLKAEVQTRGGNSYDLAIVNTGDGQVTDLEVELDGQPITEHPDCAPGHSPDNQVAAIPSENYVTYRLNRTQDSPPVPLNLHIDYVDAGGREREFSRPLTF